MKKIERNDPCWCGSGKKYKKCHLQIDHKTEMFRKQGYDILPREVIKTPEQIDGIRTSGDLTRYLLDMVGERIAAGVTTEEINTWVHEETLKHGAIPAPLNYHGFPKSVCTSINQVICHGIPDDTVLKDGDIINVDVTSILNGYFADSNRMYMIGDVSPDAKKLVNIAKQCMQAGIDQIKPFEPLNNIGRAIEKYAVSQGCSVVRDLGGHGVGLAFHEPPFVDHYAKKGKGVLMMPGMTFTVEPMINAGAYHCKFLRDGWTVVTRDGSLSAQWEHTIVVTNDGYEILT